MLDRILNFLSANRQLRRPSGTFRRRPPRTLRLRLESLEARDLFAGLPFGAVPDDTGEFMLGRIAVTPVFLESNGQLDPSTENWTPSQKASVLSNIQTGLAWWKQLLATKSSVHSLDFVIDATYVDNPAETPYEPITRTSNAYIDWVSRFLVDEGFSESTQLESNVRAFNHSQRVKLDTDWAFTIFVVNSQNDADGSFAPGGSFDRAFAFAGGLFEIVPSTRPASTFAHETGHMFWARDEYIGGGNYLQKRGYYNAQNTNAIDLNPTQSFVQADSIMSSGGALDRAFQNVVSPPSTLAQIGWVDSDSDGIFDVLDVPLKLEGLGQFDSALNEYSFDGHATVQTLPNSNSSGLQNDITINRIDRIEYRFNNGPWQELSTHDEYQVDLNFKIPVPTGTLGSIEIRAVEATLGTTSNVFSGTLSQTRDTAVVAGIQGFAWQDQNQDGQWQSNEQSLSGNRVRLVDNNRQPIVLQQSLEPDNFPDGLIAANQSGILIEAVGDDSNGTVGVFADSGATTGTKVFRPYSPAQLSFVDGFRGEQQKLRVTFAIPTTSVSIDAVASNNGTVARLDAYNSDGKILRRYQSPSMNSGDMTRMQVVVDTPEIAYVIASGYRNSKIKLDNLIVGPDTETQTSTD
ncbi:MAG: protein containing Planctomycete extracellular domain protein, partial [Pirellula sp.]